MHVAVWRAVSAALSNPVELLPAREDVKQLHTLSYGEFMYSYSVLSEQMLKMLMCIWKTYPHGSTYLYIVSSTSIPKHFP